MTGRWVSRKFGYRRTGHKHCITDDEEWLWIKKREKKDRKWREDFDQATKEILDNEKTKRLNG